MTTAAPESGRPAESAARGRADIEAIERLVPIQFGILYGCLADASKTVYLGQWHGTLDGKLDVAALTRAWQAVVARHTILRTAFDWQLKAEPLQIVLREVPAQIDLVDLADAHDAAAQQQHVGAYLTADRLRGFNLSQPPLMRLALLRLAAQRHVLVWTRHHLICDGWSLAELLGELMACYAAGREGRQAELPPAAPYARYVKWWQARDLAAAERFWSQRLAGIEAYRPAPDIGPAHDFREQVHVIDGMQLDALRAACRTCRITLNTLVQGAWGLVLARSRGLDDVVFGATETLRPEDDEGGVCLGPQINTLPVVVRTWTGAAAGDWLRDVQAAALASRRHGKISLPEIAACAGAGRGQALFDSVLVFQNYPLQAAAVPAELGLALSAVEDVSIPDLPLNLIVEPGSALLLRLIHDRPGVGDGQARALLDDLAAALHALARAGTAPLWSVDFRPDLAPGPVALDAHPASQGATVLDRIAAAPDAAIAMVQGEREISYGELKRRARAVAGALVREAGPGRRIGLLCRSSIESIVGLLGIQWSGGAYVPLDPGTPAPRLATMIADASLAAVVVDPAAEPPTGFAESVTVPLLPLEQLEAAAADDTSLPRPGPEALAYVIFTSGSTGRPKGVMVEHRSLLAIIDVRPQTFPEPIGGALLTLPLIFDGSVAMLFSTLARGARLVLPDPAPVLDASALCRTIARTGVTHTLMVPSLHATLLDVALPGQLASLATCAVAGEACERGLVQRHFAELPTAALVNEYGPTETTIWATAHRCTPADAKGGTPIGRPISGTWCYLLDAHLRPVLPGAPGELFVGGRGVTRGYAGNPALTAERFLPDPWSGEPGGRMYRTGDRAFLRADGNLMFLGRADDQIKLRGYRIEPGEIETVLRQQPGIAEAMVVVRGTPERLVAYVAGQADAAALRQAVAARLPAYMVPSVVVLADLPRLPGGKLDRRSLPELAGDEDDAGPPPEPGAEAELAALWRDILGREAVSATRDFFDLGGTSLLGMRLVAQVRAKLGAPMELHDLFRAPTIRALAAVVDRSRDAAASSPAPIVRRERQRVAAPRTGG